jgi:hypothetical protein
MVPGHPQILSASADGERGMSFTDTADNSSLYWSADGQNIVVREINPASARNLYVVPVDGSKPARTVSLSSAYRLIQRHPSDSRLLGKDRWILATPYSRSGASESVQFSEIDTRSPTRLIATRRLRLPAACIGFHFFAYSRDGERVAFIGVLHWTSRLPDWLRDRLPKAWVEPRHEAHLFCGNITGGRAKDLGIIRGADGRDFMGVEWIPGTSDLSFVFKDRLYRISTE